MRPFFSCLIFLSFLNVTFASQSAADSLLERINSRADDTIKVYDLVRLYQIMLYSDSKKAKALCDQANELSKKLDYPNGVGVALKHYGVLYQYQGKYDSARLYYDSAKTVFLNIPIRKQVAAVSANTASSYYDQGRYHEALALCLILPRLTFGTSV